MRCLCLIPRWMLVALALFGLNTGKAWSATRRVQPQVIGGAIVTDPNRYPWMVGYGFMVASAGGRWQNFQTFCGGSLIARNLVLTAAHCFDVPVPAGSTIGVHAGSLSSSDGGQLLPVVDFALHPSYNKANLDNDLMLVLLPTPAQPPAAAIDLRYEQAELNDTRQSLVVTGWGATVPGVGNLLPSQPASTLKELTAHVYPSTDCAEWLQNRSNFLVTYPMRICASATPSGAGVTCSGDSGGPLVVYNNGPRRRGGQEPFAQQVGVLSAGFDNCGGAALSVYAAVANSAAWLQAALKIANRGSGPPTFAFDNQNSRDGRYYTVWTPWVGTPVYSQENWLFVSLARAPDQARGCYQMKFRTPDLQIPGQTYVNYHYENFCPAKATRLMPVQILSAFPFAEQISKGNFVDCYLTDSAAFGLCKELTFDLYEQSQSNRQLDAMNAGYPSSYSLIQKQGSSYKRLGYVMSWINVPDPDGQGNGPPNNGGGGNSDDTQRGHDELDRRPEKPVDG